MDPILPEELAELQDFAGCRMMGCCSHTVDNHRADCFVDGTFRCRGCHFLRFCLILGSEAGAKKFGSGAWVAAQAEVFRIGALVNAGHGWNRVLDTRESCECAQKRVFRGSCPSLASKSISRFLP